MNGQDWLEEERTDDGEDTAIGEYDLTSTPNDFNVKTIIDFISSQVFVIPTFQRNYVWDIKRASKLIESLILGLPVPQVFLYEESRNRFLVIDGQQRLMSLFYFTQKRFPRLDKRGALRLLNDQRGALPREIQADDAYFTNFNLQLPSPLPNQENRLNRLNYDTLGEHRTAFDLRTVRCVIIKQNAPPEDSSSVYEIFNRLNTGGVNLTPQEIRTSLYHSAFYDLLYRLNTAHAWRRTIGDPYPDLRLRDVELLLRAHAMLLRGDDYRPSMTRFLNQFSKDMKSVAAERLELMQRLFDAFLDAAADLPSGTFGTGAKRINVSVFEAVFAACCQTGFESGSGNVEPLQLNRIQTLKGDPDFIAASTARTTDKANVAVRLSKARQILTA